MTWNCPTVIELPISFETETGKAADSGDPSGLKKRGRRHRVP
jgi:hypothetical protein